MVRSIATLMILVAQTAAGVGGPQYRCVDNNGSVCVDAGPRSCHCCHDDVDETSHGCDGHEHDAPAACAESTVSTGDCDCTHELLVGERSAGVSRDMRASVVHEAHQSAAPFAAPSDMLDLGHTPASLATRPAAHSALPLILLSAVSLRC